MSLIYALLSSKKRLLYIKALEVIGNAVNQYLIRPQLSTKIMSDLEREIIDACKTMFPRTPALSSFFYLGQTMYQRMRGTSLPEQLNDKNDRSLCCWA